MFGPSTPFGQSSSSSPLGFAGFGQPNCPGSHRFDPITFSNATPFGSPTGESIFGGTSTAVIGPTSSPLASTTAFGPSSSPAFSASFTHAFGSPSLPSSEHSILGQNHSFGGFGSSPNQSNSFGSAVQQTHSAFGSNVSVAPGLTNQYAFGTVSAPVLGATSTPVFGTYPAFGTSSTHASSTSRTPNIRPTFSWSTWGSGTSNLSRTTPSPSETQISTSAFGVILGGSRVASYTETAAEEDGSSKSAGKYVSISAIPIFKDKIHEELRWEDYQLSDKGGQRPVCQTTGGSGIGNPFFPSKPLNLFGPPKPVLNSAGFTVSATPAFSTSGNIVSPSNPWNLFSPPKPVVSSPGSTVSAIPAFNTTGNIFSPSNPLNLFAPPKPVCSSPASTMSTTPASSTTENIFSPTPSNLFAPPEPVFSYPAYTVSATTAFDTTGNIFSPTLSKLFRPPKPVFSSPGSSVSATPAFSTTANIFSPSTPSNLFAPQPQPFSFPSSLASTPVFTSSPPSTLSSANLLWAAPSIIPSTHGTASTPAFTHKNPSYLFSPLIQSAPLYQQNAPAPSQPNALFEPIDATLPSQTNIFSTQSHVSTSNLAGFVQTTPSSYSPLQLAQTAQTSAGLNGSGIVTSGQNTICEQSASQSTTAVQPATVTSPFRTEPSLPQVSVDHPKLTPSHQYGISSIPVLDKPASVRNTSLLIIRTGRSRLRAQKYDPKSDGPKVPFFSNDEKIQSTPKANALVIPRENPRAFVLCPLEEWRLRASGDKLSALKHTSNHVYKNGNLGANSSREAGVSSDQLTQEPNGMHDDHSTTHKGNRKISECIDGEDAIIHQHGADVEATIPKLQRSDYYTEPRIQELAAKERAEPGFCRHVKDFVVGRHGYGNIKFLGDTDVRQLDLESHVQFNNREVIVYMDESKKPPVGQGLNKPAEVTLLNMKCIDKKTGKQFIDGPKVDNYREMLIKKATEQGAEFVTYDPLEGRWKFKVQHFSRYNFRDETESR